MNRNQSSLNTQILKAQGQPVGTLRIFRMAGAIKWSVSVVRCLLHVESQFVLRRLSSIYIFIRMSHIPIKYY